MGYGLGSCAQRQAADVVVGFFAGLFSHLACTYHHRNGLQISPIFGSPFDVLGDFDEPMLPLLNASLVVGLCILSVATVRLLGKPVLLAFLKLRSDLAVQVGVVGLERQDVIGFGIDDVLGDRFLAPHGIYGDNAALDAEQLQ